MAQQSERSLVLRHRTAGGFFANDADALAKNKGNPNADLYSRLDELEALRNPRDGKFHFEMCFSGK